MCFLVITGICPLASIVCYNSTLVDGKQAADRMKASQNHKESGVGSSAQPCPSARSIAAHRKEQDGHSPGSTAQLLQGGAAAASPVSH